MMTLSNGPVYWIAKLVLYGKLKVETQACIIALIHIAGLILTPGLMVAWLDSPAMPNVILNHAIPMPSLLPAIKQAGATLMTGDYLPVKNYAAW